MPSLLPRFSSYNNACGSYVSPHYRASIDAEIIRLNAAGKTELAAKAAKVAEVPTFIWISNIAAVNTISGYLRDAAEIQKNTGSRQSK